MNHHCKFECYYTRCFDHFKLSVYSLKISRYHALRVTSEQMKLKYVSRTEATSCKRLPKVP
jgi:hypothetical protein